MCFFLKVLCHVVQSIVEGVVLHLEAETEAVSFLNLIFKSKLNKNIIQKN